MPTRGALQTEVRRLLDDTASIRFTNAQINTWLDMGNSDALTRLGPFDTAMATISTVVNEPNYQMPSGFLALKEVYLQNQASKETKLRVLSQDELNSFFGIQWREDPAGEPVVAFEADYNVLGLHPTPDTNNASKTLRVFYYKFPSAFASDSDSPVFIDALHDSLAWYAVSRGYAQIGDRGASDWALQRYENLIKRFYSINGRFSDDMAKFRWG